MKSSLLLIFVLFFAFGTRAQTPTCTASFVYSLSPNGNITFSNTSVNSTSVGAIYIWDTGNGMSFTTTSVSQAVSTTYTSNGTYQVYLTMTSANPLLCYGVYMDQILCLIQGCPLTPSMTYSSSAMESPTVNFFSLTTGTTTGTTFNWDFDDGTTGTGPNLTHTFLTNGGFGYTLTAINNATCNSFARSPLGGSPMFPFVVVCGYTPVLTSTVNPLGIVDFSISATSRPWYVNWNFADAPFATVPTRTASISHTYFNGIYNMDVFSFTTLGNCPPFSNSVTITVTNNPCYANAAFTYTSGNNGTVQFSTTSPSTNTNIAYSWYFGDGVNSNQLSPTHTFTNAGNYRVILISYDLTYPLSTPLDTFAVPCRSFSAVNINITNVPCIANSNFSMQPGWGPQSYYIVPAYLYNVSSAVWDWGDGSSSTGLLTYHTYSAAGSYDICLTVTTSCGASSSLCVSQYLSKGQSGDMLYVNVIAPDITNGFSETTGKNILFNIFPNPCNDGILNVSFDNGVKPSEIQLYDLLGKQVLQTFVIENESSCKLDVSMLNNGIYFLKLKTSPATKARKLIISRQH